MMERRRHGRSMVAYMCMSLFAERDGPTASVWRVGVTVPSVR